MASARFHAVSFAGLVVGSTSRAAGVLFTSAKSGENVSLVYEGHTKLIAGAAVTTLGYPLTITTSGFFIAATSGSTLVGRALSAAASGDLIQALVNFENMVPWGGV